MPQIFAVLPPEMLRRPTSGKQGGEVETAAAGVPQWPLRQGGVTADAAVVCNNNSISMQNRINDNQGTRCSCFDAQDALGFRLRFYHRRCRCICSFSDTVISRIRGILLVLLELL